MKLFDPPKLAFMGTILFFLIGTCYYFRLIFFLLTGLIRFGIGGGTNPCGVGLDLSGSWQQGHSATYNAPPRI